MNLTLTLDRVILHNYQISLKLKFFLWTDGHLIPALLGRLGGVDLKKEGRGKGEKREGKEKEGEEGRKLPRMSSDARNSTV